MCNGDDPVLYAPGTLSNSIRVRKKTSYFSIRCPVDIGSRLQTRCVRISHVRLGRLKLIFLNLLLFRLAIVLSWTRHHHHHLVPGLFRLAWATRLDVRPKDNDYNKLRSSAWTAWISHPELITLYANGFVSGNYFSKSVLLAFTRTGDQRVCWQKRTNYQCKRKTTERPGCWTELGLIVAKISNCH